MEKRTQHISYGAYLFVFLSCLFIFFLKVSDLPSRFWTADYHEFNLSGGPARAQGSHRLVLGLSVDINEATLDELTLLPGIGEDLARLILKKRRESGGFRSIEELEDVKGIGEAKLRAIGPFIEVKAPPDI
jgi:competence ComEA-like helix-hairpin-helix protein